MLEEVGIVNIESPEVDHEPERLEFETTIAAPKMAIPTLD